MYSRFVSKSPLLKMGFDEVSSLVSVLVFVSGKNSQMVPSGRQHRYSFIYVR